MFFQNKKMLVNNIKKMDNLLKLVQSSLSVLDNQYVSTILRIFLVLYAGLAAPALPKEIAELMANPIAKLVVLFLVVYTSTKDSTIALLVAVGFTLTIQTLNNYEALDDAKVATGEKAAPEEEEEDSAEEAYSVTGWDGGAFGAPIVRDEEPEEVEADEDTEVVLEGPVAEEEAEEAAEPEGAVAEEPAPVEE